MEITKAHAEVLIVLMEECSEAIQACSKILRFGADNYRPDEYATRNIKALETEIGQIIAMIHVMEKAGFDLDANGLKKATLDKVEKMKLFTKLPHQWLTL